ncbi:MAG: hypothetical protein UX08_C0008G0012 [Candidatus Collierbacteria bacterium GW2011_GWB1_45_35]|uniref:Uncharacterized protein n=2 Tax=Candidatus Collieribacteriota TaxID=1752725 RepID=A0A0G1NM58_9BACT|nr:MAG: hypothetical protein UW48_C0011G0012 [Microgenomates group bacterium GW2011_GWC1_44_23]KKT85304.1 MAG: hypothetical protein UW84_C0036G0011 [Candidatus Collierbacteria bacterium GW2011_GWA2_44_99]KKT95060.1 MAG: hypothetical protein UW96_C0011G0006 [Candidatus Collierbacteria bacterium GW2011_GWA1_45_15]KKT99166.1 MAG: hypothetical protein UX01_C0012G0012 [Candidatus Collierbacteria bacterium GW2011_GWB2_45_17]KKU05285.1 MAG: hypothetical protein UX08_C0008G0012 [Candidatus Collierbacte
MVIGYWFKVDIGGIDWTIGGFLQNITKKKKRADDYDKKDDQNEDGNTFVRLWVWWRRLLQHFVIRNDGRRDWLDRIGVHV